jgi:hypothetical protein
LAGKGSRWVAEISLGLPIQPQVISTEALTNICHKSPQLFEPPIHKKIPDKKMQKAEPFRPCLPFIFQSRIFLLTSPP